MELAGIRYIPANSTLEDVLIYFALRKDFSGNFERKLENFSKRRQM